MPATKRFLSATGFPSKQAAQRPRYGAPYGFRGRMAGYRRFAVGRQAGRVAAVSEELKFHDVDVDDAAISTAGTIQNTGTINIIAQNTTESTRIGRKCTIRAINWRYSIDLPAQASMSETAEIVRVILYLDKQCNGATATTTNILETDNYQSFNQLANKSRFRILMDRTHTITSPSGIAGPVTGLNQYEDSFYTKCNIPLEFDNSATTGALTTIRSNNLGVLLISKTGDATGCAFDSKFRLRFSDV